MILLQIGLLKILAEFEFGGESTSHACALRLLLCVKCWRIFILPISIAKNRPASSSVERKIFALPARLGGLGLTNPTACADCFFQFSIKQTKMLVDLIVSQQLSGEVDLERTLSAKKEIKQLSCLIAIQQASDLDKFLDQHKKRLIASSKEKGSSIWLTSLPIEEHGFYLHKGEFRDALCLRYGWAIPNTPQSCICGHKFEVDHALSCKRGGFVIQGRNELRDFTASLLTEVCHNVAVEPSLQPLSICQYQGLMSKPVDSGIVARMHSLTLGFLTHMLLAIAPRICRSCTEDMNKKRRGSITSEFRKLRMGYSRLAWEERARYSTRGLLTTCQGKETCLIK